MKVASLLLLFGTACGTGTGIVAGVGGSTASVQVVNAATTDIDLLQSQSVQAGGAGLAFGAGAPCQTVEAVAHGLSVRPAGIRSTVTPLPSFTPNERYLDVVTGTTSSLSVQSFRNTFTPASGNGGVRLVNSTSVDSYDIYVTAPGAALGAALVTAVAPGTASSYFNVPVGLKQVRLTTTGSTLVAFDLGNVTIVDGGRFIVILAPPAAGGTALRPFLFQIPSTGTGC